MKPNKHPPQACDELQKWREQWDACAQRLLAGDSRSSPAVVYTILSLLVQVRALTEGQAAELLEVTAAAPCGHCLTCARMDAIRNELQARQQRSRLEFCTPN